MPNIKFLRRPAWYDLRHRKSPGQQNSPNEQSNRNQTMKGHSKKFSLYPKWFN
jgi:hypothetical protein